MKKGAEVKTLDEIISDLPKEDQAKIAKRTEELIDKENMLRSLSRIRDLIESAMKMVEENH